MRSRYPSVGNCFPNETPEDKGFIGRDLTIPNTIKGRAIAAATIKLGAWIESLNRHIMIPITIATQIT